VEIRRADAGEIGAIVELARTALGWAPDDPNEAFFRWKHLDNPAGPSPMWVAVDQGHLVGVRVFLRWRFVGPDGRVVQAVRAVDTATHPDAQGRGIFTALTLTAIDELADEGIDLVFNTPNDQSRPGYLKMGWEVVGRVPIAVRPRRPRSLAAMVRAREPAAKWSSPTPAGRPATGVLADTDGVTALLHRLADTSAGMLHTDRDPEHLRWRYRFEPLHYRAVVAPGGAADGLAVFRLRARGPAREAAVCELLAPDAATARLLLHEVAASTGADYLIAVGPAASARRWRMAPLPNQGPVLTWRAVATRGPAPALDRWGLSLGDVELF
jgi:GNAT superfamily N-acetyltransferase